LAAFILLLLWVGRTAFLAELRAFKALLSSPSSSDTTKKTKTKSFAKFHDVNGFRQQAVAKFVRSNNDDNEEVVEDRNDITTTNNNNNMRATGSSVPPPPTGSSSRRGAIQESIDACDDAYRRIGHYPSIAPTWFELRKQHWDELSALYRMVDNKLGAYFYASRLGVRTPRILFCGRAEELYEDILLHGNATDNDADMDNDDNGLELMMKRFGRSFVSKPLDMSSAKGVRVVADGVERMKLDEPYKGYLQVMVEELVQSPGELKGKIPPDYKFYTQGGGSYALLKIDRNGDSACLAYADPNTPTWEATIFDEEDNDRCRRDEYAPSNWTMREEMTATIRTLLGPLDGSTYRVDLFEPESGPPILGEFTRSPHGGHHKGLLGCVHTHRILRNAVLDSPTSDDGTVVMSEFVKLKPWTIGTPYREGHWAARKFHENYTAAEETELRSELERWIEQFEEERRRRLERGDDDGGENNYGRTSREDALSMFPEADGFEDLPLLDKCRMAKSAQDEYWAGNNRRVEMPATSNRPKTPPRPTS